MIALPEQHRLSQQVKISMRTLANEPFILFPRSLAPELYDQIISLCQRARFSPNVCKKPCSFPRL
jgi:hypothetical protein